MPKLFRIFIYFICGTLTGALIWGLIVELLLLAIGPPHGEGFISIPAPFLFWLALIIGGINGALIGLALGSLGTTKLLKAAAIAFAATVISTFGYFLIIDPGIFALGLPGSMVSLINLAKVTALLAVPSPLIGIATTLVSAAICGKFEQGKIATSY